MRAVHFFAIVLLFCTGACQYARAQSGALQDSLVRLLDQTDSDTARLSLMLEITEGLVKKDAALGLDYANSALTLAHRLNMRKQEGMAYKLRGNCHYFSDNFRGAHEDWSMSLRIFQSLNESEHVAVALNNLGIIAKKKGDLNQAMSLYKRSLSPSGPSCLTILI